MKRHLLGLVLLPALIGWGGAPRLSGANSVGDFEGQGDVGVPKISGSASYDAANQEYAVTGAGTNMWSTGDQFQFVWNKTKGDVILRARVELVGKGGNAHRKAGWMVRPNLDGDAPYADALVHGDGHTSLQFRRTKGGITDQITLPITNANVLQFERRGGNFIFSAAQYGEPFVSRELTNLDLGDEVYAGLFVCSHDGGVLEKAVFREVRIIRPVKADFTPYRDYIGSVLEILEVQSGRLETIYSSTDPFEAPNWTTDGKALIYNVSGHAPDRGRLKRFDLATKGISKIDTGSVTNNNDHVLSFDGKILGISGQGPGSDGESCVFTVPVAGGFPHAATWLGPSYLHGWSPNGEWVVFTGGRKGKFDIYKTPADGSDPEVRLTDAPGLNDGSEYSPDGQYIYFNSNRSGKMQLWRMKPDGSGQEQLTNDEFNNWFPHVSPDGKWIAFLSYAGDVASDSHPYYKQVYLRLMPVDGGKPKVIAYVYGGQGTMNVPSWAPDSKRIAFVSNSDL